MFNYMMNDFRKVENYSPKSSPRGGRSQDSSGTLKTTISLGKNPSIVHSGPFYLMKEPPSESRISVVTFFCISGFPSVEFAYWPIWTFWGVISGECDVTGATNLMSYNNLEHSYSKYSGKKVKEQLSSFLPNLPGVIDGPGQSDNSSLRSVIDKPPIVGKELLSLTSVQLAGFRLHPGPLPEQYRYLNTAPAKKHKNKHKKHKHKDGLAPQETIIGKFFLSFPKISFIKKNLQNFLWSH